MIADVSPIRPEGSQEVLFTWEFPRIPGQEDEGLFSLRSANDLPSDRALKYNEAVTFTGHGRVSGCSYREVRGKLVPVYIVTVVEAELGV